MRRLLPCILVLLVSSTASAQTEQVAEISVDGLGQVPVTPDQAAVIVSVETRSDRANEAAGENAKRLGAVIEALRNLGLGGDEVVTTGYTVAPEWKRDRDGNRELSGYLARNTVQVRLEQLDQIGQVIDASLAAGANRVESVRFGASTIEDARKEALAVAVRRAASLAAAMAEAAGGTLGPLIEMRMQSAMPSRAYESAAMREQAPMTPIMPSEVVVTAVVHTRWEFRKGN